MKKILILLLCLLPFSAFAEEEKKSFFGADLDITAGVSSDYIFRGYNQNGGHLAVNGGAAASGRVGVVEVFGGIWASQVDYDDDTTYEYDLYAGGNIDITDNISIEGIFTRFGYDGTVLSDIDEVEGTVSAYGLFGTYSVNINNTEEDFYKFGYKLHIHNGIVDLLDHIVVGIEYGKSWNLSEYQAVTLEKQVGKFTVGGNIGTKAQAINITYEF